MLTYEKPVMKMSELMAMGFPEEMLLNAYRTLSRYGLRDKLTANARREASTRYSYDAMSSRLAEFYRESIEEQNN